MGSGDSLAPALVAEVHSYGGQIAAHDGALRLSAPRPLPNDLLGRLRNHKHAVLGLLGEDANPICRWWLDQISSVAAQAPLGVPVRWWNKVIVEGQSFCRTWAPQAVRLGWDAQAIFGIGWEQPYHRIDLAGLVPLLPGKRIVVMTEKAAIVEGPFGPRTRQTYHRKPVTSPPEVTLLWELPHG